MHLPHPSRTRTTVHPAVRVMTAVRLAAGTYPSLITPDNDQDLETRLRALLPGEPNTWADAIRGALPGEAFVAVTGTLDRRLLVLRVGPDAPWVAADLSGQPHRTRTWPHWAHAGIHLHHPNHWLSTAELTADAHHRLSRPRVLLAALYRREIFPLPRFSLSISDLARAARATLSGSVQLIDMQLGATLDDILTAAHPRDADDAGGADIIGISATFGQHDLLTHLLDTLYQRPDPPLILAGGSLTARNEHLLLQRYPHLLIARGAGEPTVADVIAHWHHDLNRNHVRGIGYTRPHTTTTNDNPRETIPLTLGPAPLSLEAVAQVGKQLRTAGVANRTQTDFLPELDLLDATFTAGGVAQLETSRGCTSACSFCPRGHKGHWAGTGPDDFTWILPHLREVFTRHPDIAPVLYLVDEEFIGRDPDAVTRARQLAATLHTGGFSWETSCRIDQVAHPDADRAWHHERADLWRHLLDHGLRRCLFGIESGVTSILQRFNKETTAEQNATGIRTPSVLGVPTRYTYITFDHLMTLEELEASYAFQGRTDLILHPRPDLDLHDIVDGVHDPDFIATHSTGAPFYRGISYMLVSMECLTGAAYTRRVHAAGLTRTPRPAMGRVDADFADWRIGICSDLAQRWVDRHFPLDYTLKSLEKTLDGTPRQRIRTTREVLKDAAYDLLGDMLTAIRGHDLTTPEQSDALRACVIADMDRRHHDLRLTMQATVQKTAPSIPARSAKTLTQEHERWRETTGWNLINETAEATTPR